MAWKVEKIFVYLLRWRRDVRLLDDVHGILHTNTWQSAGNASGWV
jgi:hypothetical protein